MAANDVSRLFQQYRCGKCATEGTDSPAQVLMLVQDPGNGPEVIPFCYECAAEFFPRYKKTLN